MRPKWKGEWNYWTSECHESNRDWRDSSSFVAEGRRNDQNLDAQLGYLDNEIEYESYNARS